ncbi:hypothetical protein DY000_02014522 [Brassica cretica]|uniref:DUF1985 domain-containing protein n=1 Tax=Brassica cretica TaxID=69181 RepID=A0ABQ7D5S1_BRACR|nr:hypothetical protein DY000_02014522 [Brassica cretica]
MSFGGSQWCRPMSMDTHRSIDHDEDRSTDYSRHPSTSSAESTAECSAVRIMTHEEFAEKHPHPPSPFYVKIDRPLEPAVDRQRETDIDRPPSSPIDQRAPLTYLVRLPSIDNDRINALRPPPKPSSNPPEPTTNPSDTTPEPMQVDKATEGRRLWMFFGETKETEEDIRRMFHHVRERMKLRITLKKKSDPGKFAIPCGVKVVRQHVNLVELGNDLGYIAACHCGAEYETEYAKSIDTRIVSSIDSNESPTTDERYPTSLDGKQPVDHFTLPDQCYPDFAFQQPNNRGRDDYSIGSWADSGFHESFAVDTVIPSSNEDPTEEYDEDYWKERAIEIAMQDDRYSGHSFNNTSPPSIDRVHSASVDTHPHPAKRSYASIDTIPGTSIDIKAAAFEKEKGNIPIPNTTPEPMQVDEATEGRRLRKRKEKIPKNLKREANEKEMDGFTKRVLRIPVEKPFDEVYFTHRLWMFFRETKETEEDIRRMFHHVREMMKLRITLKKKSDPGKFAIPYVVNLVELGNDLGYIAACHCGAEYETEYSESIDTSIVSSIDSNESPTTDERYPTSLDGKQPVDNFTLPDQCYPDFAFQKPNNRGRDDYSIGSWADSGFLESFAVDTVIPSFDEDPTEEYDEDCWKERAIEIAMHDDIYSGHSFNNTSPPSIDRVHSASVDTHLHPAKRSYASIDTIPGTSIDIKATAFEKEKEKIFQFQGPRWPCKSYRWKNSKSIQRGHSRLQVANRPDNLFMQQRNIPDNIPTVPDEHPGANTTAIDLDTIRKKDPQPATSIDICTITSIDSKFAAMEDRLQSYEDMHDRFTSPTMRYLDRLSTHMMKVQKDIGKLHDQHDFQDEGSTSIDRFRRASLDDRKPTEHLLYTAA